MKERFMWEETTCKCLEFTCLEIFFTISNNDSNNYETDNILGSIILGEPRCPIAYHEHALFDGFLHEQARIYKPCFVTQNVFKTIPPC